MMSEAMAASDGASVATDAARVETAMSELPRALAWVDIARSEPWTKDPYGFHTYVTITPELASEVLRFNARIQRNRRKEVIRRYRRDMEAGKWARTADPIRFTLDGDLIDGQHRLSALADAKDMVAVKFWVQVLEEDGVYGALDQATPRRAADLAKARAPGLRLSAAEISAAALEASDFKPRVTLSKGEQADLAIHCDEIISGLRLLPVRKMRSALQAVIIRCLKRDRDDALKFFTGVVTNNAVIDGKFEASANLLSTWLLTRPEARRPGFACDRIVVLRAIQLWNAYRKGRQPKRLPPLPESLPEVL